MDSDKLLVVCTNSVGDRKLYTILRNSEGQVWVWKQNKFVDFVNDNYLQYVTCVPYMGGDAYVAYRRKDSIVFVYLQSRKEPDIYDQIYHVYGAEMPDDIPDKIRPLTPMAKDPVSRPRSKVKLDAYSDG